MILIKAGGDESLSGSIEFVASLWNEKAVNGFFVIGGDEVTEVNLKFSSNYVRYKNKAATTSRQPLMTRFFSNIIPTRKVRNCFKYSN